MEHPEDGTTDPEPTRLLARRLGRALHDHELDAVAGAMAWTYTISPVADVDYASL